MDDSEKQARIMRYLRERVGWYYREIVVFEKFRQELKRDGSVGIPEALDRLRRSPEVQDDYQRYLASIDLQIQTGNQILTPEESALLNRLWRRDEEVPN